MNPPASRLALPGCVVQAQGLLPPGGQPEPPHMGALIARAQGGNHEAFCELCALHEGRLLALATVLCHDATFAEDLAQDVLLEAWRSLGRYHGRCRFFTWLCAILLNRWRHEMRKRHPLAWFTSRRAVPQDAPNAPPLLVDDNPRPDRVAAMADLAVWVRACLQRLPPKHRQVVLLRFYADSSLEEIALALGCSRGTVKSRLFHALAKLRLMKDLGKDCIEP